MTTLGEVNVRLGLDASRYQSGIAQAQASMGQFTNVAGLARNALLGITAGFSTAAIVNELKNAYLAAEESAKVQKILEATIKATGNSAGLTGEQLADMATGFMNLTAIDDEVIKGGQTILLTFRSIGKDVFPDAMKAALDMSTVMGTDLNSAVLQVGKALNNPIEGLTALKRVGVSFTEEQKKMITELVNTGQGMKAQQIIIAELSKEFGGAAEASKTATQTFNTAVGELQETIGAFGTSGAGASFLGFFTDLVENVTAGIDGIRIMTSSVDKLQDSASLRTKLALNKDRQDTINGYSHMFGIKVPVTSQNQAELNKLSKENAQIKAKLKANAESTAIVNKNNGEDIEKGKPAKPKKGKSTEDLAKEEAERIKKIKEDQLNFDLSLIEKKESAQKRSDKEIFDFENQKIDRKIKEVSKPNSKAEMTEYNNLLAQKQQLKLDYDQKIADTEKDATDKRNQIASQEILDNLDFEKELLDNKINNLELEVEQHKITLGRKLELERQYIQAKKDLDDKAVIEQLKLVKGNSAEEIKVKRAGTRNREKDDKDAAQNALDIWKKQHVGLTAFEDSMTSGWSQAIGNLINGNTKFVDAFSELGGVIENSFASSAEKMVEQWLESNIQMFSISKATALGEGLASSFTAIINAIKSVIGIPVVGPEMAVGAAAQATAITAGPLAAISALSLTAREYGGPVEAGQPYIVGEKRPELYIPRTSGTIIPNLNNMGSSQSTITISPTYHLSAIDSKGMEAVLKANTKTLGAIVTQYQDKESRGRRH